MNACCLYKVPYDLEYGDSFTCPTCGETTIIEPWEPPPVVPLTYPSWRELRAAFVDMVRTSIASKVYGRPLEMDPDNEDTIARCKRLVSERG